MYTTSTDYETYTGGTAPADYERQELHATTLFKKAYPNFPSETQFSELDSDTQQAIEYAIFEQISEGVSYTGTVSSGSTSGESFTIGSFSQSTSEDTTNTVESKLSFAANIFLDSSGVTYKGVGICR